MKTEKIKYQISKVKTKFKNQNHKLKLKTQMASLNRNLPAGGLRFNI